MSLKPKFSVQDTRSKTEIWSFIRNDWKGNVIHFSLIKWSCQCIPSVLLQISFDSFRRKLKTIRLLLFFLKLTLKNITYSILEYLKCSQFQWECILFSSMWHVNANLKHFLSWWVQNYFHKSNPLFILILDILIILWKHVYLFHPLGKFQVSNKQTCWH